LPRVPAPHDVEPRLRNALVNVVESSERRIEFFASVFGEAGPVAGDEAELLSAPLAEQFDRIIAFGRTNFREEPRLQRVRDETAAFRGDLRFLLC
jgi:hypothetical protein